MINKLNNTDSSVANSIFTIFQNAYKIEAELINTDHFPPLFRTVEDIENATTLFYGFFDNHSLAAVIEIIMVGKRLEINSLTVDPKHFRKGIAHQLITYVLQHFSFTQALVETAAVNIPAIKLYQKHGFVEYKRWTPSHGIKKVAMSVENIL